MKISRNVLSSYVAVPAEPRELRDLLDDLGLEVKRIEAVDGDLRLTLELLANRGDHHGYNGLAREIRGRTGDPVTLPEFAQLKQGASPLPLVCETALCLRYSATLIIAASKGPASLPDAALAPLFAAGLHSVSAPVDATNLANLEFGQPTHAFDADTLDGGITIRLSRPGERAWPLFQAGPVDLPEGTLVIADDSKILAIAGLIGCEESKTTATTTRILLESATFDPVSVRKAARALNIHTDASARFERGADPSLPLVGAGRVVHLLESTGAWRHEGDTGLVGDWTDPELSLKLRIAAAAEQLAIPIQTDEAARRLGWLGFTATPTDGGLAVRVPPHRLWDVEFEADLVEELAKSVGYNNSPVRLPGATLGALPTPAESARVATDEILLGAGFYEVITDGFYGRQLIAHLGLPDDHPIHAHVETLNSLDRGYSLLKNNALVQAVEAVSAAIRRRESQVKLFEWTRTFHPDAAAENGLCTERPLLWAACTGEDRGPNWEGGSRPADAIFLKGLVEELGVELGLPLSVGPADIGAPLSAVLHPGRQASVRLGDQIVGLLGELHPGVARAFGIKRERVCYLEISASALAQPGTRLPFVEPGVMQPIDRSLAFTLPHHVEARAVADTLRAHGPAWMVSVRITDLFRFEEDGQPRRAVTYALRFSQEEASRSADEVNEVCAGLIAAVEAKLGGAGVGLRA